MIACILQIEIQRKNKKKEILKKIIIIIINGEDTIGPSHSQKEEGEQKGKFSNKVGTG